MPLATRINDDTTGMCSVGSKCCPHSRSGRNSSGSSVVFIDSLAAHRLGDSGVCNCPHGGQFQSTGGSSFVFFEGQPAALVGHSTVCQGCGLSRQHVSGSATVEISG